MRLLRTEQDVFAMSLPAVGGSGRAAQVWKPGALRRAGLLLVIVLTLAAPANAAHPQPAKAWRAARIVFGVHARTAYCIAQHESTLDPHAVSPGGGNYGLWQINKVHKWVDWSRIFDPVYNARCAFRISHGGTDWSPWTTRGKCGV